MAFARIRVEAKQTISSCGKATAPVSAGATGNGTFAASGPASVSQPQSAAPVNAQSASSSRDSSPQRYSLPARGISSPGTLAARHRVASADDLVALASRMSRSTAEPAAADNAATPKDAPNAPGAAASTGRASRSPARDVRRASVIRGAGNACGSSASASGLSLSPGHRRSQSAIVLSLGTRVNEGAAAAAEDITMAVGTTAAGVAPGDTETSSPDQQHRQQQQQVKPFNRHGSDFRVNGTKAPDDPSRASSFACEPLPPPQHQQPAPMSPPLVPRLRLSPLPSTSFTSTFASTLDSTSNFCAAYASTSSAASALSSSSVLPPLLDSHPSARQLLREEQRAREVAASVAAIARSKGLAPPPTPTHAAAAAGAAAAATGLSSGDAGLSAEWASGEPRVLQTAAIMTDPEATASAASMPVPAEVRATETVPLVASQQQQQILIRRLLPLGWQLNGSPLWRWAEEGLSRQQPEEPLEQFEQWDPQEVVSAAGIGQRQRRATAPGPRVGPCPAAEAQLAASAAWASAAAAPAADGGGPGGAFQPAAPGGGAVIVLSTAAESLAVASSDVGGAGEAHASAASVLYSSSTTTAGPAAMVTDPAVATDATCNGSASVPSPGPVTLGHPVSQPSGSSSGRLFTPFMRPTAAEPFFLCTCTPRAAAADECGSAKGAEVQQPAPGPHGRDQAQWQPAASDAVTDATAAAAAAESSTLLLPVPPTPDGMGPRPLRLVPSLPAAAASSGHGAGGGFGFGFHRLAAAPLSRLASAARPGAAVTCPVAGAAAEVAAGAADGAHAASATADGSGSPEVCAMVAASAAALRRLRRLRNLRRTLTGGGELNVFRIRHFHHHDAPGATGVSRLALTTAVAGAAANVLTLLPGTGGLGSALSTAVSLSSAAAAMTRAAATATATTDAAEPCSPQPFHQEQHSSSQSGNHRGALLRPGSGIWGGGGGGSGSVMALVAKALADVLAGQGAPPSSRQALRRRVRAVVAGASLAWTAANVAALAGALGHLDFGSDPAAATKTLLDLLLSGPSLAEAAQDLMRLGVLVGLVAGGGSAAAAAAVAATTSSPSTTSSSQHHGDHPGRSQGHSRGGQGHGACTICGGGGGGSSCGGLGTRQLQQALASCIACGAVSGAAT